MAKYILTNKAVEDLTEIWDYTYKVCSENQVDKYYELIITTCEEVVKSPEIGKSYNEISEEIFAVKAGKHLVFYRELRPGKIEIVRILHGRMDLKSRLDE